MAAKGSDRKVSVTDLFAVMRTTAIVLHESYGDLLPPSLVKALKQIRFIANEVIVCNEDPPPKDDCFCVEVDKMYVNPYVGDKKTELYVAFEESLAAKDAVHTMLVW